MPTRLILIRHGVTDWNIQNRYCGSKDISLSKEGIAQAGKLRKRLNVIKCDRVYSSDRKRATQTAGIIFRGVRITRARGLREIDFGVFEGLSYKEIMKKYPGIYKKWLISPFKTRIPQAEAMGPFRKRVELAIKNIARLNLGKTIAVVCHGGVISVFITGILKNRDFWHCIPSAGSITVVEYCKNKPKIKSFNETAHLR
ncbi:MAG: histidine phosphatase family protein [Candidatus Omnitrophota bacterium]